MGRIGVLVATSGARLESSTFGGTTGEKCRGREVLFFFTSKGGAVFELCTRFGSGVNFRRMGRFFKSECIRVWLKFNGSEGFEKIGCLPG
jgi:hypothetical protein